MVRRVTGYKLFASHGHICKHKDGYTHIAYQGSYEKMKKVLESYLKTGYHLSLRCHYKSFDKSTF